APAAFAVRRHSGLLRGDAGPAADQEVVYGLTVHTPTLRAGRRPEEGTASTRLSRPAALACNHRACSVAGMSPSVENLDRRTARVLVGQPERPHNHEERGIDQCQMNP